MESTRLLIDYDGFPLNSSIKGYCPVREILIEPSDENMVDEEEEEEPQHEENYNLWFEDYGFVNLRELG
jgi:hypothetical protein